MANGLLPFSHYCGFFQSGNVNVLEVLFSPCESTIGHILFGAASFDGGGFYAIQIVIGVFLCPSSATNKRAFLIEV